MLLIVENFLHFLIWCFYICSDIMFSESLIMHEEWLTHLFLTFIIYHVNLLMFQLLIIIEMFIELNEFIELTRFIELKKFKKKKKNEWLFFDTSKYLINLFQKISSDCFICNFHLKHKHLQSLWLSLQFAHHLLFINTTHSLM